jgi:hypothetical protein
VITYNYSVYRGHQLWTKTLTQVKAIRLVNELIKQGFTARYERINQEVA